MSQETNATGRISFKIDQSFSDGVKKIDGFWLNVLLHALQVKKRKKLRKINYTDYN